MDPDPSPGPEGATNEDDQQNSTARKGRRRLSEILAEIGHDAARDDVSVNDLIRILKGRGRAALILLFAVPNVLPMPPGTSGVLGLPLLYLSLQMMLDRTPWLPRFIGERSVPRERFGQMVERLGPWLARAERLLRPRWSPLVGHPAEHILGALCLVLAAVLTLPIPFGNILPALAICVIALGILERDGLWIALGTLLGLASLLIVAGVVYALVKSALYLLVNAFA
ncbi:exopolysaccharide biosynthesis protein [Halovulum dunhuangense]|uniref:Exopolysaccharide biosynthesis protein n=1 Tax=Halovulum dunhuangense TaxID=1505036 RepID=A0A849L6R6_9RHOB|nr:exopolysaccharide biosynthesis protein [Halovulum dunhuangense]NNU81767.1 exopolysaccharide biosynthesis protein [Halovulum dunhuangense]